MYERVIINRKEPSVAVDRMDINWWLPEPFLGQRDLFYVENREDILTGKAKNSKLAFVRHCFWYHKIYKMHTMVWSNFSSMSYKRAFGGVRDFE